MLKRLPAAVFLQFFLVFTAVFLSCGSDDKNPVSPGGDDNNLFVPVGDDNNLVVPGGANLPGLTMVSIPGGTFRMGADSGFTDISDETPHNVTVDAFQMSATEITQAQYIEVMKTNPSYSQEDHRCPVEQVRWYDAVTFCNKLSRAAGLHPCYNLSTGECDFTKNGFRLPTEAEWEYACRAGTSTAYYTGDTEEDLSRAGWYYGNSEAITHPVGRKEPNSWGLYDMHGNVKEWCNDWWDPDYYNISPDKNPTGPETGPLRVFRGGSYLRQADACQSAYRNAGPPEKIYRTVGFRIVRPSLHFLR